MDPQGKPKKAKAEARRPLVRKLPKDPGRKVRDLEKRLADALGKLQTRDHEMAEALEQQTATSDILRVISSSPTDLQPVFDSIVRSASRLCNGDWAAAMRFDGKLVHLAAQHNPDAPGLDEVYPCRPNRRLPAARAILEGKLIHIPDAEEDPDLAPGVSRRARSFLVVPMLRESAPIGVIAVSRPTPGLFPPNHVALLSTFAAQAVIAIENVRLFNDLQEKNRALNEANAQVTESLEQQTATSEILRVIASSPTDVQPVFDAVAESAARLCEAFDSAIFRRDGDRLLLVAHHGPIPVAFTLPLVRGTVNGRAVLERRTVHIDDLWTKADEFPEGSKLTRGEGVHAHLSVPLIREGVAIGTINLRRTEAQLFTERQVALLQTFADQAVIAIENVRLFKELQEKNRALTQAHAQVTEALEQQTATSEILRVISQSPTDIDPVFDTILTNAVRLCGAVNGGLYRFDGERFHVGAACNFSGPEWEQWLTTFPRALSNGGGLRVAAETARIFNVPDTEQAEMFTPAARTLYRNTGIRSTLFVPMARREQVIGVMALTHRNVNAFTKAHADLLQTFADQAVIAIENVRLFTELQASNRELTTALETQSATSDILRVISRSQTDAQPVFDAIVTSAVRLLRAHSGSLTRLVGDQIELAALTSTDNAGDANLRETFPRSLHSAAGSIADAIRDRAPLNVTDTEVDPRRPEAFRAMARARGYRSQVVVPLLRHGEAIGAIAVTRREPGGFTDDEIALLQTLADQAVIAIENARLFSELQARTQELTRSVDQLTALGDVGRAVSSSLDLDTVLTTIVGRAVQLSGTDGGTIFEYDEGTEEFAPRATLNADETQSAMLRATRLRRGEGAVGQMAVTREPIQIPDIAEEGAYESRLRGALLGAGTRALLAIPLLHEERIVGGLVVSRRTPGEFTVEVVEILKTFATQSALAIQNARLFKEIEVKSRELEAASRHKSEFLTNMSHELRTPLNAIIGYSEMLQEEAADLGHEPLVPDLQKINAAAKHLLSLINDILDLSKVEAGRMELESAAFDLPTTIDDTMLLMRERASRRGIGLERHVEAAVGQIRADERKVKQVLLNLLSNAVKFTPEGGHVDVHAALVDGRAQISVTDTGTGIATEDQEAVFEEFRQVGKADKKAEGTGLGLALCRKFVELHGGRIWVTSQIGAGSTFTFTLPLGQ